MAVHTDVGLFAAEFLKDICNPHSDLLIAASDNCVNVPELMDDLCGGHGFVMFLGIYIEEAYDVILQRIIHLIPAIDLYHLFLNFRIQFPGFASFVRSPVKSSTLSGHAVQRRKGAALV